MKRRVTPQELARVEEVMSNFDFEDAERLFKNMNWKYGDDIHSPSTSRLRITARFLLQEAVKHKTTVWYENGRFRAGMIFDKITKDSELVLSLEYAATSSYAKHGE